MLIIAWLMPQQPPSDAANFFSWYGKRFKLPLDGVRDFLEIGRGTVIETDWPKSLGLPRCIEYVAPGSVSERAYFCVLTGLKDAGFIITKVLDTTQALNRAPRTASPNSARLPCKIVFHSSCSACNSLLARC